MSLHLLATYLPPWTDGNGVRTLDEDEDSVTLGIAAGAPVVARVGPDAVRRVVIVTRDPVLLEGDSGAVTLAGLGLPSDRSVEHRLGGAPDTLDAILAGGDGTLVVGVDHPTRGGAGAGAVLLAGDGATLEPRAQVRRSLPVRTRWPDGSAFDYEDARLERDRGLRTAMSHAALGSDLRAVAGVDGRTAASLGADGDLAMPTSGASSPVFALASLVERRASGTLAAVEQATLVAGMLTRPGEATVLRHEAPGRPRPARSAGRPMAARVSLPAYDRAFESKLYLKAARCPTCAELSYPPRSMCLSCGGPVEGPDVTLARTGVIYSVVTVRVPVPGLATPYSLAVVELDGTGVRTLVPVTGVEPGTARIGDRGTLVFRRILVRSGVPDYGYAFWPEVTA